MRREKCIRALKRVAAAGRIQNAALVLMLSCAVGVLTASPAAAREWADTLGESSGVSREVVAFTAKASSPIPGGPSRASLPVGTAGGGQEKAMPDLTLAHISDGTAFEDLRASVESGMLPGSGSSSGTRDDMIQIARAEPDMIENVQEEVQEVQEPVFEDPNIEVGGVLGSPPEEPPMEEIDFGIGGVLGSPPLEDMGQQDAPQDQEAAPDEGAPAEGSE